MRSASSGMTTHASPAGTYSGAATCSRWSSKSARHFLRARFQPTFWTAMPWRPAGPPDNANGLDALQASDVLDISHVGKEISASLQCRNCEPNCPRNPPRHKWGYMRVESQGMATPATPGELRVKFECANCESIHIAEALPAKGLLPDGRRWSMADAAVRWIYGSLHVNGSRDTVTPRHTNPMTAGAYETRAPDSVQLAAESAAAAAPVTSALGRSSGRKRRKTRRAIEAAE